MLSQLLCHQETFWPADQSLPSLAPMVGPRSWQLLDMLGEEGAWLTEPCSTWETHAGFRRFQDYVTRLEVVNDAAERDVKLVEVINIFISSNFE